MKTDLTKQIERALDSYDPTTLSGIKINKFRGRNTAYEVPVSCGTHRDGLIDCVRIYEYFRALGKHGICRATMWGKQTRESWGKLCLKKLPPNELTEECDEFTCKNHHTTDILEPQILIVCYEIKISKADFKSKNGHNFVGHQNYYVIPKDLFPKVENLVPDGIGVVLYNNYKLKIKTPCKFHELTHEEEKWLLLSMLKKK